MHKPKILFVGDYCRKDFLSLLDKASAYCEFYFLEFISPKEESDHTYLKYGTAIYWSRFNNVKQLLNEVEPNKVVFLFIESYNHVILNLACKRAAIPTFHLEHGLRADYVLNGDVQVSPSPPTAPAEKICSIFNLLLLFNARLKNRFFLQNSLKTFNHEDRLFLKHYISIRKHHSFIETSEKIKSPNRTAMTYISFSPKIFAVHQEIDALSNSQKVIYIGVPYFDNLATITPGKQRNIIIFIDQPLAENHLLQWDSAFKKRFVKEITVVCQSVGYELYIKPHPKQNMKLWESALAERSIFLINDEELYNLLPVAKVAMGFYSTYLLPLAAMPHITLITLENHPVGKINVSKAFIEAGVTQPVYELKELNNLLLNIKLLHKQQLPNKAKFTQEWMYKFDGRAGERLRDILLSDY